MELTFAAATDVGRQRDHNEDNFLVDKKLRLFLVADGMGGHAAGEVASAIAIHQIRDALRAKRELIEGYREDGPPGHAGEILRALEQAVQQACAAVYAQAQAEPDKRGMGTTATALLIAGGDRLRGFIAHVGDTRVYLSRQGQSHALTEDHSLLNELVRRGKLNKSEIDSSPYKQYKNSVTRAVGIYASVQVDTFDFDVLPGDQFLLCSDGLHAYLEDEALPALLDDGEVADVPARLIELANAGGGHDNITGVVVRVGAPPGEHAATDVVRQKLEILRALKLFRYLSYKELVRVTSVATLLEVPAAQIVFTEGQAGDTMYAVTTGRIRLSQDGVRVADLGRGQHFGEMSLVERSVRSLTATAVEPTTLVAIQRADFFDIIKREPALAVKLLWSFVQVLGSRLRKTNHDLSEALAGDKLAADTAEHLFQD
ncbi:MAG: protein phosphatase 2C domain-containing protein [Kofleriaceae bacterium]